MKSRLYTFILAALVIFLGGCVRSNTTPTNCNGPYTWAYGTVSAEFLTQVQQAMQAQGLTGSLTAGTFGEQNGDCGYGAMAVDYAFTVEVEDLGQGADLTDKAAKVLGIAMDGLDLGMASNLGNLSLLFQSEGGQCFWFYREGAWNAGQPTSEHETYCPVPPSAESQALEEALETLPGELGCESSSITTNEIQSVLVCERAEGQTLYKLTTTLRLNEDLGYVTSCFHGYTVYEADYTGEAPMSVTDSSGTYYERDRTFEWLVDTLLVTLYEQVMGGQDVEFPAGINEQVYQGLLQTGLIPGEGSLCP